MDIIPEPVLYYILSFNHTDNMIQNTSVSKLFYNTIIHILHNLKSYTCEKISKKRLSNILQHTTNLKCLKINQCYLLNDIFFRKISPNLNSVVDLTIINNHYVNNQTVQTITSNMKLLTSINLTKCRQITSNALITIANNCVNITKICVLYCNLITNDGIIYITTIRNITHLDIGYCIEITSWGLIQSNLSNLRYINLTCCYHIMDNAINHILNKARYLEEIDIGHCDYITDTAFFNTYSNNLKSICVRNVTNITLRTFPAMHTLTHLNILGCHHVCELTLHQLLKTNPHLKVFNCKYCNNITTKTIDVLIEYNKSLEELYIGSCYRITRLNLDKILDKLQCIKKISLYGCSNISFYGTQYNINIVNSLEYLDLSYCSKLNSYYLCNLIKKCYNLTTLFICGCNCINSIIIDTIIDCLSNMLEKISLTSNSKVSLSNIKRLLSGCTKLKSISLDWSLSSGSLLELKQLYSNIKIY